MRKAKRSIEVVITDTHGGLKVALMNPETVLFQEDENGNLNRYIPALTASQDYLWKLYTENIADLKEIADGADMMTLHLGDECNGNKYPQALVSDRISDQIVIAEYNMRPLLDLPNMNYFRQVTGTAAHNFGQGASGQILCTLLESRYPGIDISPLYHGLLYYDGVSIDYAHHGPGPGSRDWLKGNVARFYLRDMMIREIKKHRVPPRLVLRGHYHVPVHEYLEDSGYKSELYICPSYSMLTDHAVQVTQSQFEIAHGMTVFEFEDGEILREHRLYKTLDIRTTEEIWNERTRHSK